MVTQHAIGQREILIDRNRIRQRIHELAYQIAKDYGGKQLLLVIVLKGAFVFGADLQRALWDLGFDNVHTKFIGVSSYGNSKVSSGNPIINNGDNVNVSGRHVLFVEDIIDTGFTVKALFDFFEDKGALSMEVASLVSKPEKRKVDVHVRYIGFEIGENDWIEGYGIDTAQYGRGNPDIVVVQQ